MNCSPVARVDVRWGKTRNGQYGFERSRKLYDTDTPKEGMAATSVGWFVSASPVLANGLLYVGSWDRNFYALDPVTGAIKWKFGNVLDGTPNAQVDGAAIVVQNGVVIGNYPSISGVVN